MQQVDIRNSAITEVILRKIVRKLQYRSQAALRLTSRFGQAAVESYGAQLVFIQGWLDGVRTALIAGPLGPKPSTTLYISDLDEELKKQKDIKKDDVVAVINNQDCSSLEAYQIQDIMFRDLDPVQEFPFIIFRRPRNEEIFHLNIEYELRERSEYGLGFDLDEVMIPKKQLIVTRVHWSSQAQEAGLKCGDQILKINGEEIIPTYADVIAQLLKKVSLKMKIRRIGF